MKINKKTIAALLLFIAIVLCCIPLNWNETNGLSKLSRSPAYNMLPDTLRVIGEGAFEGTAFTALYLPGSVEIIEGKAFAEMQVLQYIYISENTKYIASTAFQGVRNLLIVGKIGSYAEKWACRNGYKFTCEDKIAYIFSQIWKEKLRQDKSLITVLFLQFIMLMLNKASKRKATIKRVRTKKTMRPQERAELHAIALRFP